MSRTANKKAAADALKPQWSTAASDAVLSFLTLYACSTLVEAAGVSARHGRGGQVIASWQLVATAALGLTGLAAAAGTLRFAGVAIVRPAHDFLTQLSMFLTMPLLGLTSILAYTGHGPDSTLATGSIVALFAAFVAFQMFPQKLAALQEDYVLLTALFGTMCVFFRAAFVLAGQSGSSTPDARAAAWYGIAGTVLVMAAGGVGAKGTLQVGPLKALRVDVFHYLMALGNICLVHLFTDMWRGA